MDYARKGNKSQRHVAKPSISHGACRQPKNLKFWVRFVKTLYTRLEAVERLGTLSALVLDNLERVEAHRLRKRAALA